MSSPRLRLAAVTAAALLVSAPAAAVAQRSAPEPVPGDVVSTDTQTVLVIDDDALPAATALGDALNAAHPGTPVVVDDVEGDAAHIVVLHDEISDDEEQGVKDFFTRIGRGLNSAMDAVSDAYTAAVLAMKYGIGDGGESAPPRPPCKGWQCVPMI